MKGAALQIDGGTDPRIAPPLRRLSTRLGIPISPDAATSTERDHSALNDINYEGLSVEWEDQRMDRWFGAKGIYEFVKKVAFPKNVGVVFDAHSRKNSFLVQRSVAGGKREVSHAFTLPRTRAERRP